MGALLSVVLDRRGALAETRTEGPTIVLARYPP
jgi:hypothetical protein